MARLPITGHESPTGGSPRGVSPVFLVLALLALLLAGTPGGAAAAAPSIVLLVSIDGARADLVASRAYAMPELSRLAADAAVFGRATTPSPQTFPATVSLLTGANPIHHGVRDEFGAPLGDDVPTLATAFAGAGWTTAAFPGDALSHRESGIDRGFSTFVAGAPGLDAVARADSAAAFIAGHADTQTFVWIDISLVSGQPPWQRLLGTANPDTATYLAKVREADAALGRLRAHLEAAGLDARTLWVVTGTHGEVVPEWTEPSTETLPGHGLELVEDALRVPLVVRTPGGGNARGPDTQWVSTVDIAPTVLDLAGIDGTVGTDGISLRSVIEGAPAPRRTLVHETDVTRITGWPLRVAARNERGLLVRYGTSQRAFGFLPGDGTPAPAHPGEGAALVELAATLDALYGAPSGASPPSDGATALAFDEESAELHALVRIREQAQSGDTDAARTALEALCRRYPSNPLLTLERAFFFMYGREELSAAAIFDSLRTSRPDFVEAEAAYAEHLLQYGHADVMVKRLELLTGYPMFELDRLWMLGSAYVADGQFAFAQEVFRTAIDVGAAPTERWRRFYELAPRIDALESETRFAPEIAANYLEVGRLYGELELYKTCYMRIQRARGLDAYSPEPEYWLGYYLLREQRPHHALVAFNRAIEKDPTHLPSLEAAAGIDLQLGELDAAFDRLTAAVADTAASPESHYNLACLLARQGDTAAALDQLEAAVAKGYDNRPLIETDTDLDPLRDDPRFARLRSTLAER